MTTSTANPAPVDFTIRPFQSADASAVARLVTQSVDGHWTYTPEQFREHYDEWRIRLVAEREGEITATAAFYPFAPSMPGTLRLDFAGDETLYSALYLTLLAAVPVGITRLFGVTREDWPPMRLFHAAGFRNAWQSWGAHLNLRNFDPAPLQPMEEHLFLQGYEIEHLREGAPSADWEALHALYEMGTRDAPRNPTTTLESVTASELREMVRREEAAFVVRLRGELVASTRLTLRQGEVESEQTVTASAHRGKGVATVLKAHALRWAREQGYEQAGTGGTVLNLAMLRVNAKLGYVPEPMWVTWERHLSEGE